MTAVLPGSTRPRPVERPDAPLPLTLSGVLGALRSAGLGLAGISLLVVLGWALAHAPSQGAGAAVRASGHAWLLAHHVALDVPGGTLGIAPLGAVALTGWLLVLGGRAAARASQPRTLREAWVALGSFVATYAAVATLVALTTATSDVRPRPLGALLVSAGAAALAGGVGLLWGAGLLRGLVARLPRGLRAASAGAAAGVGLVLATGALVAGAAVVVHADRVTALARALDAGGAGDLFLALLGVAFVPNAVVWTGAVLVGPGFAVGEGTSVTLGGSELGAVPAFPLLGALPGSAPASGWEWLLLVAPVVAGCVVALTTLRRLPGVSVARGALLCGAAGALGGALLAALAGLAGGPVGGGRLAAVGPSPWQVGLAAALELAVVAAVVAAVRVHRPLSVSWTMHP